MTTRVASATLRGIEAELVTIEVQVASGLPGTTVIGLPDSVVRESRDRVKAAIEASGFRYPSRKVLVNLAPAHTRKEGAALDLAIGLGVLVASERIEGVGLQGSLFVGELSLDGALRPVRGALACALRAARDGFARIVVPSANGPEAAVADGPEVHAVADLADAARLVAGQADPEPVVVDPEAFLRDGSSHGVDLADVAGHDMAKRALLVAAAGGHNLLFVGPPGTGKTMLARRLATILPPLSLAEAVEVTRVHGAVRPLERPLLAARPFRAPHHSASLAALVGGGPLMRPGEISLAHRGVLFLDELAEFRRDALEALRQPLEDGRIVVGRARASVEFPADFALVGAMNPCPCGFLGHPDKPCSCLPSAVRRYRDRVSGPLLDRIDLHLEVHSVEVEILDDRRGRLTSAEAAASVARARAVQAERFRGDPFATNARIPPARLEEFCSLDAEHRGFLRRTVRALGLSSRGHDRALRVARTAADLEGSPRIEKRHLAEALFYRGAGGEMGPRGAGLPSRREPFVPAAGQWMGTSRSGESAKPAGPRPNSWK